MIPCGLHDLCFLILHLTEQLLHDRFRVAGGFMLHRERDQSRRRLRAFLPLVPEAYQLGEIFFFRIQIRRQPRPVDSGGQKILIGLLQRHRLIRIFCQNADADIRLRLVSRINRSKNAVVQILARAFLPFFQLFQKRSVRFCSGAAAAARRRPVFRLRDDRIRLLLLPLLAVPEL